MKRKSANGAPIELQRLLAKKAEFERALHIAFNWPRSKPVGVNDKVPEWLYDENAKIYRRNPRSYTYGRRPPKWKQRHGYEFVAGVLAIQQRDKCSVAAAIRKMKKADAKKWPEAQRVLERRFQELKEYWGPWYEWGATLDAKLKGLTAAAVERVGNAKPTRRTPWLSHRTASADQSDGATDSTERDLRRAFEARRHGGGKAYQVDARN